MPSGARKRKSAARPAAKSRPPARRPASAALVRAKSKPKPKGKPAKPAAPSKSKSPAKPAAKPTAPPKGKARPPAPEEEAMPVAVRPGDSRRHVMSLSFLRDGDEFLARMETDTGQITELKNRSLDQLLTLVASELEDILE